MGKVLLLSAYDSYGAGTATYRLLEGLVRIGYDSQLYVKYKSKDLSTEIRHTKSEHWYQYAQNQTLHGLVLDQSKIFSLSDQGTEPDEFKKLISQYDVIHLHWVNGFISIENIKMISGMGIPLVITMHDENLYTGGCHYRGGCEKYRTTCQDCPQLIRHFNDQVYINFCNKLKYLPKDTVIITPSSWLKEMAKKSRILCGHKIEVIQNGVDERVFRPRNRFLCREKLGAKKEDVIVLFGACELTDQRKGINALLQALALLQKNNKQLFNKIKLVCFGNMKEGVLEQVQSLGYIQDEEELSEVYTAADLFVLPSLEDNLPNVIIESLMCGTPVLAFQTGGIPEMIINHKNGILVEAGNVDLLAEGLEALSRVSASMRQFCRENAVQRFGSAVSAGLHIKLYESLYGRKLENVDSIEQEVNLKRTIENQLNIINAHKFYMGFSSCANAARKIRDAKICGKIPGIYGYGTFGKMLADIIGDDLSFIADKNYAQFQDKTVISFEDIKNMDMKKIYVFISVKNSQEIVAEFEASGMKRGVQFDSISWEED